MHIDGKWKRINPHADIEVDGVTYYGNILQFPDAVSALGIREIAEPEAPADYDQEFWYRQEIDEAPYVIYTKKSDDQIAAIKNARIQSQIDAIEIETRMSRQVREFMLSQPNAASQSWYAAIKSADDRVSEARSRLLGVKPKTKKQRILEATAEYNADIRLLNDAWLAASVSDGQNESSVKASIVQQIADRDAKFKLYIAAIKAS